MSAGVEADFNAAILAIFREQIPDFTPRLVEQPFRELDIDSFGLLSLRFRFERFLGSAIDDRLWVGLTTPADLIAALNDVRVAQTQTTPAAGIATRRQYVLNMPQMALGGISESWLFKELGDLHWSMICAGLDVVSSEICDGNGERLYATFTRLKVTTSHPMASFGENDSLTLEGKIARFGGSMFFSDIGISSAPRSGRATVLSSFTKRGEVNSNDSLLKGQPNIPLSCPIESLAELPPFAIEYGTRRRQKPHATLFECDYRIIPYHDINGVGLLYFAAYPIINDICELNYMGEGNGWARRASTISRDIYYFANANPDERLIYRVHARRDAPMLVEIESSLSRSSDNVTMAYLITRKAVDN